MSEIRVLRELTDTELDAVSGGLGVAAAAAGTTSAAAGSADIIALLGSLAANSPPSIALAAGPVTWAAVATAS